MAKEAKKKPPELGSTEWIPFHELGLEISIRHIKKGRDWSRKLNRIMREEKDRLRKLRRDRIKEYGGDEKTARLDDPDLFAGVMQEELLRKHGGDFEKAKAEDPELFTRSFEVDESEEAYASLFAEMFSEAVAGIRPVEGIDEGDAAGACNYLTYLGGREQLAVALMVLNQQTLSPRQTFPASRTGDAEAVGGDPTE